MAIFQVDATGVHVPSLEEAQAAVLAQLSAIFGDDLARASQTPQAQLAGVIAILEAIVGEALVRLGNAQDPDKAVGTQLDTIGSLLDILRDQATRSRVTATVTGVPGTNLPALSRAKTTAEAEFRTTTSVTLAPQPGVTVDMEAVDFGPVEAAAGTLTEIVTVIPRMGDHHQRILRSGRRIPPGRPGVPHRAPDSHRAPFSWPYERARGGC